MESRSECDANVELGGRRFRIPVVPENITIDIAHGHADSVKNMIAYIKDKLPASFVIAGNVATPEAVIGLENWGADATKVGSRPALAPMAASASTVTSPRASALAPAWS